MNINALITHQFNKLVSNTTPTNGNKFAFICRQVKKMSESVTNETVHNHTSRVVRSILLLRDICVTDEAEPNLAENLIRQQFLKNGVILDVLAESALPPTPVRAGVYTVRGQVIELEEDLLPIDECLGHSVYRTPEAGYFLFSEAKKRVDEDAPVNAVGHGNIAGVSPGQEPPGPKGGFKGRMRLRRKKSPQIPPMDGWPK